MFEVILRPSLEDNIMPFVISRRHEMFWCIDPGDKRVLDRFVIDHPRLSGAGAFCTHHHNDHVGALSRFHELFPKAPIYGPDTRCSPMVQNSKLESDVLPMCFIETPGHTVPAFSYYLETSHDKYLFSGDTLFGAGCGRLFEGSPEQMWNSLQKLRTLPPNTLVICGHEYTLNNLQFVATLGWREEEIQWELERVQALRSAGQSTLPRSIQLEKETNPFFNADDPELKNVLGFSEHDTADAVFASLRKRRDAF